jgi:hypothetical protein
VAELAQALVAKAQAQALVAKAQAQALEQMELALEQVAEQAQAAQELALTQE